MYQYINLASVLAVALVVYLALHRFSPVVPTEKNPGANPAELRARYGRFHFLLISGFLLTWAILTFATNWLLDALLLFRLSFLNDVLFIVPPDYRVVLFNACCIAFLAAFLVFWRIACFNMLTSWEEYKQFVNLYFRFDLVRSLKTSGRVLALFTGLLTLLVFDWYTTFGDQEIKANGLFGLGTRKYEYKSIIDVNVQTQTSLLGDILDKPFCVMTFEDQFKWKSLFTDPDESHKILDLVMTRSSASRKNADPVNE